MINKLILEIKNMDMSIVKVMKICFNVSFLLCLFSTFILSLYNTYPVSHIAYDSSLILFRTGLFFAVSSFMSAFVINKIKWLLFIIANY